MDEFEHEEKLEELEKKIEELKSRIGMEISDAEQRLEDDLKEINESFRMLRDILTKMHMEKEEASSDREFLMKKHKELIRKIPVEKNRLSMEVKEKLTQKAAEEEPYEEMENKKYHDKIKENAVDVKDESGKTPIDELFELIMEKGSVNVKEASAKFGVHEAQIEEWAKILQEHNLIEIHYPVFGKPVLKKISVIE